MGMLMRRHYAAKAPQSAEAPAEAPPEPEEAPEPAEADLEAVVGGLEGEAGLEIEVPQG